MKKWLVVGVAGYLVYRYYQGAITDAANNSGIGFVKQLLGSPDRPVTLQVGTITVRPVT